MADNESIGTRSFGTGDHTPPPEAPSAVQHSTPRSQLTTNSLAELPRTRIADADPDWQVPNLPAAIGRFKVLDLLGHGGFGFVYRAYDPDLNRQVALKVPRADAVSEQFLEEARAAAQLKHPNIVTIYDVGRCDEGRFFIAMEFVDGPNLSTWVCRDPRSPKEVAAVVARVAEAVHFAHKSGFVHRDLKPGNILIDCDGSPKVADFGLALHESQQHLRQGEVAGTPAFMAPEQITGTTQQIDGRTDIWALGVILYRLLSGRQPFDVSRGDLHEQILRLDPKPLRQIDDSIPLELDRLCHQCLAKLPENRPSTARDVARALEDFCHSSALDAPTEPVTHITNANVRQPLARWLVVSGGLCAVLLGGWLGNSYWAGIATPTPDVRTPRPPRVTIHAEPPAEVKSVAQLALEQDRTPLLKPQDPRWVPFRGPANAVLWRAHEKEDSWAVDPDRGRLSVRSWGPSLLATGTGRTGTVSLQTTFRTQSWKSQTGIFWGFTEHLDGTRQCLLARIGGNLAGTMLQVQLAEFEISDVPVLGPTVTRERTWHSREIAIPQQAETVLQVDLQDGRVETVLLNGEAVIEERHLSHLKIPTLQVTNHSLGVYAHGGAHLFTSFYLLE